MESYNPSRKKLRGDGESSGIGHVLGGSGESECRRFNSPEGCPYGDACRYRHVLASLINVPNASVQPASTTVATENEPSNGSAIASSRSKPCTKFFSTSGCPYGEGCHFLHYVPGGVASLGISPLTGIGSGSGPGIHKFLRGDGPTGFAASGSPADQGTNLGGFKTRLCNRFDSPEGCRFGDKCHFAHGEKELRKSTGSSHANERDLLAEFSRNRGPLALSSSSQIRGQNGGGLFGEGRYGGVGRDVGRSYGLREPTPPGLAAAASFGASSTAKISIDSSLAGAIIGKGGINAKQICRLTGAKISIREHETDTTLRNVEMEGSFEQIKLASQMVRQVLMQRDNVPVKQTGFGSHNFKTKICENYAQGNCNFGDRCHFAHGAQEMREH